MPPRLPQPGEPFLLDGFRYLLSQARTIQGPEGTTILQAFERPAPADAAEAAAWRANFHYKRSGLCNQAELVWYTPAEWASALREQAFALARGKPAARVWATAAVEALLESAPIGEGAWALPDRHLLHPPVIELLGQPATLLPDDPEDAAQQATQILRHHLLTEG